MSGRAQLVYTDSAIEDLKHLDTVVAKRITRKLDDNAARENPTQNAKGLKGNYKGYYRYRIGDYRAIFDYDDRGQMHILMILKIGHRKDIYL